ncbi:hypothetical protein tb265_49920 [Gemmatimonadetes bacterium T265]|nr:hypothetical protein tb265_49920 [Gemmatimonadetes bacterium T265]
MSASNGLRLRRVEHASTPFPYLFAGEAFGTVLSDAILGWLERESRWTSVKASFYEQYEFSLADVDPPAPLAFLADPAHMDAVRVQMEQAFDTALGAKVDATVHKLLPGQRIRIHNDFIEGAETHRLVVQLNRGWRDEQGGFLMLFNSPDPSDVHRVFSPSHDTAVAFAISPDSHHAVSTIHTGKRFTLVYSFYAAAGD